MLDSEQFDMLCVKIGRKIPGFEVRYKDESIFMKILGFLLFFNRKFMTRYTTTIGSKVYFPSRKFIEDKRSRAFKILSHEYMHLIDYKEHPIVFVLLYIAPQFLGLLSLGSILSIWFGPWYLLFLIALVFFLPIPSAGRAEVEKRGYCMNIAINIWRHGSIKDETREWLKETFTGWEYYRMWPYPDSVDEWIDKAINLVRAIDHIRPAATVFDMSDAFEDVYEIVTGIETDPDEFDEL